MFTWQFEKIRRNRFCKEPENSPEALYSSQLKEQNSRKFEEVVLFYSELELLLLYFGVEKPEELVGKSFTCPMGDAGVAISLLISEIKHRGAYNLQTPESLYARAALALSKLECPDFSDIDKNTIWKTFSAVFNGFRANKDWLRGLQETIRDLSDAKVALREANIDDFSVRFKGPAEYLVLVSDEKKQRVIFGPYSTPFVFDR